MNTLIIPRQEPGKIEQYYDGIVEAYSSAFAGPPWFEKTRCVATNDGCEGGFSALSIGELCDTCGSCPAEPAYNKRELGQGFDRLATTYPAAWWLEFRNKKLAMAAFAWLATPEQIAAEKYTDSQEMNAWLPRQLGSARSIVWLDEVFSSGVRPEGNLSNFKLMNNRFNQALGSDTIAFRTITPQMLSAAHRLGSRATILSAREQVPDRRNFVIINQEENEQ